MIAKLVLTGGLLLALGTAVYAAGLCPLCP